MTRSNYAYDYFRHNCRITFAIGVLGILLSLHQQNGILCIYGLLFALYAYLFWRIVRPARLRPIQDAYLAVTLLLMSSMMAITGGILSPFRLLALMWAFMVASMLTGGRKLIVWILLGLLTFFLADRCYRFGYVPEAWRIPIIGSTLLEAAVTSICGISLAARTWKFRKYLEGSAQEIERHQLLAISSAKMATLGEMAAGMAHEIGNPLAILFASVQQIQDWSKKNQITDDFVDKNIERSIRMIQRISKIIRSLKNLSRDGKRDPFESVLTEQIVNDCLEICAKRLEALKIQVRIEVPPELRLRCSPVQVSQVLLNLISNSRDAIEGTESPWIEIKAWAASEDPNSAVHFSVSDSGKGIPAPLAEQIMRPFFSTKSADRGTGLGLAISQEIMRQHHGEIRLDPDSPHTRFVLTFPSTIPSK